MGMHVESGSAERTPAFFFNHCGYLSWGGKFTSELTAYDALEMREFIESEAYRDGFRTAKDANQGRPMKAEERVAPEWIAKLPEASREWLATNAVTQADGFLRYGDIDRAIKAWRDALSKEFWAEKDSESKAAQQAALHQSKE